MVQVASVAIIWQVKQGFFFFVDEECRNEGAEGVLGSLLLTIRSLLQSRER
jgi:hypothetical protein